MLISLIKIRITEKPECSLNDDELESICEGIDNSTLEESIKTAITSAIPAKLIDAIDISVDE